MKKIYNQLFLMSTVTCLLFACKKDETKTFMTSGKAPTLNASRPTLVLTAATAADTVETFSWTASDYGYTAAVRYSLQIAKGGTNFAAPREISMGNSKVLKYTAGDLNQLSIILGLPPGSAGQLDVRVKSSISDSVAAIYSNRVTVSITPYLVIINYPSLWVPGDYQGWDPASAPKVSSRAANGIYEGYVNFQGGTLKFKYTSDPDWNHTNYGWASSVTTGNDVAGTFNTTGGDLFVPTTGYYLLKANTNNNTWSGTRTTWSIIGSAPTLSNNWANDVPMTYDATNKIWTVTTTFIAGAFKFRANNDWAINFGDTGGDLSVEYNGTDISITTPGTYTIKLDLKPGNYNYSKQ